MPSAGGRGSFFFFLAHFIDGLSFFLFPRRDPVIFVHFYSSKVPCTFVPTASFFFPPLFLCPSSFVQCKHFFCLFVAGKRVVGRWCSCGRLLTVERSEPILGSRRLPPSSSGLSLLHLLVSSFCTCLLEQSSAQPKTTVVESFILFFFFNTFYLTLVFVAMQEKEMKCSNCATRVGVV